MSSDDLTKDLPTEDKLESLISLVRNLASDVSEIKSRLGALEDKVDKRLHDTRPIWEAVQSQLAQMSESLSDINHKITILHGDVLQVRTDQRKTNQRIETLEKQPA